MRHLFYFNRNDRRIFGAVIAVLCVVAAMLIYTNSDDNNTTSSSKEKANGTVKSRKERHENWQKVFTYGTGERKVELFTFDPNTADSTQLLRLGLQPWQVRAIYRYRTKGGTFRHKEDFARLHGLTAGQYRLLEPYISIAADFRPAAEVYPTSTKDLHLRDTTRYPLKFHPGQHVNLNTADTTLLMRVPGIGTGFAKAITSYRSRLGGYYSAAQLKEIDGFPAEAVPYFTADSTACRKLNINKLSLNELRRHPYIRFYLAKTIIEYRRVKGRIRSLEDLSLYRDFTPEVIERLRPYVAY